MLCMKIIHLNLDYLEQIHQLEKSNFPLNEQMSIEDISKVFTIDAMVCMGHIENNKLISYVLAETVGECCHLLSVCVDEKFRHCGCAYELQEFLIESVGRNVVCLVAECRRSNLASQNLLKKSGFVIKSFVNDYYDEPKEDAVVYIKSIK